ncbi:DUF1289 domain-containing protein [Azohydromonas lata]|uniref:DUF1289 domain-containing protein n=1 Tax=Azohydromonas lata TaxID=45677 RepID=UPI00389907CA
MTPPPLHTPAAAAAQAQPGDIAPAPPAPVGSPCTGVCKMDAATGWCLGCARGIDEIASWSRLDDPAKRAVWALLPARQAQLRTLHGELPPPPRSTR